ncbi:MAG: coproporphyrinogen-III oxidase [Lysobacterales bacterium]|jgi:oxygen-independent coproporphyrinogen-3 oxidase|nr:MAG: coproporphyrinogen-III oxidase [Xanthomonadales bacterium]
MIAFDPELIRRYDQPAPRYTSYPTATHFRDDFRETSYREQVASSNEDPIPRPLSLYVHIPFCFSPCFYCGCHRLIVHPKRATAEGAEYLRRLIREIELQASLFDPGREVVQLHLGGGTPTFLDDANLARLVEGIGRAFRLAREEDRDFSIEVDPRTVTPERIALLADLGFNRLSLGVQDFDPEVQLAVNRIQPVETVASLLATARAVGFVSINLDLIYGLPNQTRDSFARTLEQVVALRPNRLAVYGYAHLPQRFAAQRHIPAEALPDPETRLALLAIAVERLTEAGYRYIGMDHFALPEDELARAFEGGRLHRNFNGYSTHPECALVGLGLSSIGFVGDAYAQNTRSLSRYYEAIDQGRLAIERGLVLSEEDHLRRTIIQDIMCRDEIRFEAYERRFDIVFAERFGAELKRLAELERDGLIELGASGFRILPRGRLLLRAIARCFDAYLADQRVAPLPRHSRII